MSLKSFAAVLILGLSSAIAAHATPITGQFSITGSSVTDNGSQLSFQPNSINVGAANTIYGDFTTLLTPGEGGTITTPINYVSYVPGTSQLIFNNSTSSLTFTLASMTQTINNIFGNFTGTGTISSSIAGYDPTAAMLYFTTQGNGTVTFSATAISASPVPEPSTIALLGTGLLGAAGIARRKFLRA